MSAAADKPTDAAKEPSDAKLWGGRFSGKADSVMEKFNSSLSVDRRMWREDLEASRAYVQAMSKTGIISESDAAELSRGLEILHKMWEDDAVDLLPSDEDIHTANERLLGLVIVPEIAKRLHTGRSRNDQVLVDFKLWLIREIPQIVSLIKAFVDVAVSRAGDLVDLIFPGYTHMQRAQPVRVAHWLLSYAWALKRDASRFTEAAARTNECPLGCGALAGHPYGLDRDALAASLGFTCATANSMDTIADRDFVCDALYAAVLTGVHLSRLSEDIILFSTAEFGFVSLADAYSTGSSLMPQKKNPDSFELVRGRAATLIGQLTGFLAALKGLPSTYNKDLQEDKALTFEALDSLRDMLRISAGAVATMAVRHHRCEVALTYDMLATDLADYLVRKGLPFRQAHEVVGKAVVTADRHGCSLADLPLDVLSEHAWPCSPPSFAS